MRGPDGGGHVAALSQSSPYGVPCRACSNRGERARLLSAMRPPQPMQRQQQMQMPRRCFLNPNSNSGPSPSPRPTLAPDPAPDLLWPQPQPQSYSALVESRAIRTQIALLHLPCPPFPCTYIYPLLPTLTPTITPTRLPPCPATPLPPIPPTLYPPAILPSCNATLL